MDWVTLLRTLASGGGARPGSARPLGARRAEVPPEEALTAPEDAQQLEELFASALQEHARHRAVLLEARLGTLTQRQVPVRAVRRAPSPGAARICFANGTVLIAEARTKGQLMQLALGMQDGAGSVCLQSWSHEQGGTLLRFGWSRRSAELWAVGLDQAD